MVMDKVKIAIIHGSLVIGGAEKALINMLRYIDYNKVDITLWVKDDKGPLHNQIDPRVKIEYWGERLQADYKNVLMNYIKDGRIVKAIYSIGCRLLSRLFVNDWHNNLKYYIKSMMPSKAQNYDVVISYQSLVKEEIMILSYFLKGEKKIGWIHGECKHNAEDPYFKSFPIEYGKMHSIFCVSESVKQIFLDKYPNLKNAVRVMYNLQNYSEIMRLSEEDVGNIFGQLTLVTVGRVSKEKGQDMIPYIARGLKEKGYEFVWYIVGDGKQREGIEQKIQEFHLEKYVILLGSKSNPYPYIKNCSIYVQPSYTEGFCLTTFEAKILKKVIVLTDVPGMREQFQEHEAVFCDPTVDSILYGIESAIKNPPTISEIDCKFMDDYNYEQLHKLYQVIEE